MVMEDLAFGRLARCVGASWEVPVAVRLYRPDMPLTPKAEEMWKLAGGSAGLPETLVS